MLAKLTHTHTVTFYMTSKSSSAQIHLAIPLTQAINGRMTRDRSKVIDPLATWTSFCVLDLVTINHLIGQ